jgi:phosphatidylglycerophosphatase A
MNFPQPKWAALLPRETVLNLATLGPVGTALRAPGTWGSAAGTLFFFLCCHPLSDLDLVLVAAVLGYLAIGLCGQAAVLLGRSDPGEVILDEFVAMPLCFIGWRLIAFPGFLGFVTILLCGFALFRFYDIRKPGVIDRLQQLPGGWGIVIDDTGAALATCATLHAGHLLYYLVHHPAAAAAPS